MCIVREKRYYVRLITQIEALICGSPPHKFWARVWGKSGNFLRLVTDDCN